MIAAWKEIEMLEPIDKLIERIRANCQATTKANTYVALKVISPKG